jgi:hypothetical protein
MRHEIASKKYKGYRAPRVTLGGLRNARPRRLSIFELRVALADDRATPRFIETVPRRGYRFVTQTGTPSSGTGMPTTAAPSSESASWPGIVVGRARERAEIGRTI